MSARGFTLVEILVVIGIAAFLASMGLFIGMDAYRGEAFRSERAVIVRLLETARSRALANIGEEKHGLHIAPPEYIVFSGDSYDPNDPLNEVTTAGREVAVSGLSDVIFEQITGDSETVGEVVITDHETSRTETISINSEGQINW